MMRGRTTSSHFRHAGRLLGGARSWGGIPVTGGYTATVCWPESPVALGVSETAGRYHLSVIWQEPAIDEAFAERLLADFREELLAGSV